MVKKLDAVTIKVEDDMRKRARDFAKNAVGDTFDRFNYSQKERLEKIAWGKLGEEVVASFFSSHDLPVEIDYNVYPGTNSIDETDFVINNMKIDLKVGTQNYHKRLLVVKSYFDNGHQSDYYIAVNFYENATIAIVYGFATKLDVAQASVAKWDKINPIADYTILYDDLQPIENLIDLLKKN